jgi:HEAT repeat protein
MNARAYPGLAWILLTLCFVTLTSVTNSLAQTPAPASPQAPAGQQTPQPPESKPAPPPEKIEVAPEKRAWGILQDGLKDTSPEKRAWAVHALGLLPGNAMAEKSAIDALKDEKYEVRLAAASTLGSMLAAHAKEPLEAAMDDVEPSVVLAAANSLLLLKDDTGYDVFYAVLTGDMHGSQGLLKKQMRTLKDKKKMAEMGFEEGIGFIPFAGIGYEIFKTVSKDDASPIRSAAAKKLAHDPEPSAGEALVIATQDKNWGVRAAALEGISERDDKSLVPKIVLSLDDEKDVVRFTAAACIVHLSGLSVKKTSAKAKSK